MSSIAKFEFESNQVRIVTIEGEPWFVAIDLCEVLELGNVSQALSRLDADEKRDDIITNDTISRKQFVVGVSESGMYSLVLTSRKPQAKVFKRWITHEVIPSIRKTGKYEVEQPIAPQVEKPKLGSSVDATVAAINPLRHVLTSLDPALVDGFILNEIGKLHPELKKQINAAHSLLAANTPIAEILLTPTAIGDRLGLSGRGINALLTHHGYQIKNPNKGKTEPAYFPTEKGKPYSSNTIATGRKEDNTSYQHTKWVESMVETVRDLM
jgi:hypothetical protein